MMLQLQLELILKYRWLVFNLYINPFLSKCISWIEIFNLKSN